MRSLATQLFEELPHKFFGILVGTNARVYLDTVDAVENAMASQGEVMERAEVLEIIDRVLESGLPFDPEEENPASVNETDPLSARILRRLVDAGWIEEDKRPDYRRMLSLDPAAQLLLEAFRAIVSQSVASFTGKLRLACDQLAGLRDLHARSQLTWEELRECLALVRAGLRELRTIRRQVERYARRQLATATIAEALELIYSEFSSLITQQCYRELIHARLPERLREALEGLTLLEGDDFALQKLRDDLLRTQPGTPAALPEILRTIEHLALALGDVEPTADRVDASTAEFARRSRARIRYIQDVGSARRQQIKAIFDYVREHLEGVRLADLEEKLDLPLPRLADTGLLGTASLRKGQRRAGTSARQPVVAALADADREESLREMEKNLRNALRLDRANKFVDRLDLAPGETRSSDQLPVHTEDDLLDVISCLVFAPAGGANYRLHTARERHPADPVIYDGHADFDIERFELEKK